MSAAGSWRDVCSAFKALQGALLGALGGPRRLAGALVVVVGAGLAAWAGAAALSAWAPDRFESLADQVKLIYAKHLRPDAHRKYEEVDPWYGEVDVPALIRIHAPADAARLRRAVVEVIWGEAGFPHAALPAEVERGVTPGHDWRSEYLRELEELGKIDIYTSDLEHRLPAEMYLMHAKRPNGRLVIYAEGHNGPFWHKGRRAIGAFLARGYDVLGVSMPVYTDTVNAHIPPIGDWMITSHIDLAFFDKPLAPFFQPIAEAINQALRDRDYADVYMVGFSGGAWTATVYAAIDTRIRKSYQVSGTYPLYLRRYPGERPDKPQEWSDFEATYPPLVRTVTYLELYLLAALGPGRRHVQVLSKYDRCCFGGMGWSTYVDIVRDRARALGQGEFAFLLDTSHADHKLSRFALEAILADMDRD